MDSSDGDTSNYDTELGDDLIDNDADEEDVEAEEGPNQREPRTPSRKTVTFKRAAQKMALVATKSCDKTLIQVFSVSRYMAGRERIVDEVCCFVDIEESCINS